MATQLHRAFLCIFVCIIYVVGDSHGSFTDVTDRLLGGPLNGLIATFGDFNMDKKTDVFVVSENGHKAELYLKDGNSSHILHRHPSAVIERTNDTITSLASGDFDGDFQLDILLTTKPNKNPDNTSITTKAFIYWGDIVKMEFGPPTLVSEQLLDQPLVMDCNGDMIPDLFGEEMTGQKKFWLTKFGDSRKIVEEKLQGRESYSLSIPNSNAFVDMTGSYAANLFMVTNTAGSQNKTFEIWTYVEGTQGNNNSWQFTKDYNPPTGTHIEHLGVSTFADMDADGLIDHILPLCHDSNCTRGSIYVKFQSSDKWVKMFDTSSLSFDDKSWGFVPPTTRLIDFSAIPLVARTGDYNLDTYTDILILVQTTAKGSYQRRTVLLRNLIGSALQPAWTTDPKDISAPVLSAFIDIQRTGQLDLMIVNQTGNDSYIYLFDNTLAVDAYFVKVEVLSGICDSKCPGSGQSTTPYGVSQPGPTVGYDTTSSTGSTQRNGGTQLPQSAYFSLQLPYVILGLGQNPNFVDYLRVGVPGATVPQYKNKLVHEWTSIIPNSQLIVIPSPLNKPNEWISKILIIPGQSVLLTSIVLICTCIVLAMTAAGLHLKERKDDEKEKRQEAHRFHFDAM